MTHLMTLDDWDSDGISPVVSCDCSIGRDHHQDAGEACNECGAELDVNGRCWYCHNHLIWSEP